MNNQDLYNRSGYLTFLATLVFNLVFFVYIAFVHPGTPDNPGHGTPTSHSK